MAATALYNRWRSRTFANPDDLPLIGQDHITRTLRNAVSSGQISHAYLFCGPRGTGKTSAARILARAVNCKRGLQGEPCNACENCAALLSGRQLDLLIEIDGASNRGVDDVRALRERIMQRPGGADLTGRYKVYIIDEVHMLTTEAFNALLKSLEEPPPHVIFILATTDPQKVLPTVASRCQRFDFKPIALETLVRHLANVASSEGVELEPAALELLARTAAGGARDAVSLLDQALAYAGVVGDVDGTPAKAGKKAKTRLRITATQIQAMLGLTDFEAVCRLIDAVAARDLASGLRLVQEVSSQGSDLRQFARQVIELLRGALLLAGKAGELTTLDDETREQVRVRAEKLGLPEVVRLIKLFTQAEHGLRAPSAQPQLPLELAVVEACLADASDGKSLGQTPAQSLRSDAAARPPTRRVVEAARPPVRAAAPSTSPKTVSDLDPDDAPPPAGVPGELLTSLLESVPASSDPLPEPTEPARTLAPAERPASPLSSFDLREEPPPVPAGEAILMERVLERWPAVIEAVRRVSRNLAAMLEIAKPAGVEDGNVVVVACRFPIHATTLKQPANSVTLNRALVKALGVRATVRCEVAGGAGARAERSRALQAPDDPVVSKVLRMMNARVMSAAELAAIELLPVTAEFEAGDR
ncbi:MAG: DNA polymerase III subunit gamma/tau [Chloroflexota bacterium]